MQTQNKYFGKLSELWNNISAGYFVVAATPKESKYLKYDSTTGQSDFVDEPVSATCFDIVLGTLIVKRVSAAYPTMEFSMIETSDAMFINDVTKGPAQASACLGKVGTEESVNSDGTPCGLENIRITKPGYIYFSGYPTVGNPKIPADIGFLMILADGKWHTKSEAGFKNIPDLPAIIVSAIENNLIEMK